MISVLRRRREAAERRAHSFFSIDDKGIAFLREQWNDAIERFVAEPREVTAVFDLLVERYSEKGRVYHNLSHVSALLAQAAELRTELKDYDAVRFAIWFHDAIYNTHKTDNEDKSAEWARSALVNLSVPASTAERVREMILATKDHRALQLSRDALLFLDLDLAILGASSDVYQHYRRAIREEYSWVPRMLYRRARKKILTSFLDRGAIYFSERMSSRLETQARRNIQAELDELS
jgi:predicted metal-dependent HD superfamily phosphohydrolase